MKYRGYIQNNALAKQFWLSYLDYIKLAHLSSIGRAQNSKYCANTPKLKKKNRAKFKKVLQEF